MDGRGHGDPVANVTAEKSIRGQFDFRVAATSFLIPADWETNVSQVGPLVDEIELLFFDSRPAACVSI